MQEFEDNYDYTIFGHYDSMDVKCVEYMGDFRPASVIDKEFETEEMEQRIKDGVFDRYTIKAFYSSQIGIGNNIDYTIWEEKKVNREYPLISCIMIHLSKECIKNHSPQEILDEFIAVINDSSIQDVKCGVYFSIGYSDIIILVCSKDFDKTNEIIEVLYSLKEEKETKSNKEVQWISALYTITGFQREAFLTEKDIVQAYKNLGIDKKMSFCAALHLKNRLLTNNFVTSLVDKVCSICKQFGILLTKNYLEKCIHVTFGNIDVIFIIDLPIAIFLALYCKELNGVFSQHSDFFKEYIKSVKVSVLGDTNKLSSQNISDPDGTNIEEKNLVDFLKGFEKATEEQHLPRRLIESIIPIMKLYGTLIKHSQGFELNYIMKKAMNCFIKNMEVAINDLKCTTDGLQRGELIKDIEKSLGNFRVYIATYLNDLHRSERSFIEGKTMTHPSIGALTKLLFAYNKFIDELANENNDNKQEYAFVVISGGCDQTQVQATFHFLGPWREEYYRFFIVSIPEISLFDIRGTLFRLAHECFHYFSKRKRKERKHFAMKACSCYFAEKISEKLFNPKIYRLDQIKSIISQENFNEITKKREEVQNIFCESFKQELQKEIVKISRKDLKNSEKYFYSINCGEMIKKDLGSRFVITKEIVSRFYGIILKSFLKNQIEIHKMILERAEKWNENIAALTDQMSEMEYYIKNDVEPSNMNFLLGHLFDNLLSSIVGAKRSIIADSMVRNSYNKSNPFSKNITRDINEIDDELCLSLENFPNTIIEVMCECFADCSAVHKLGVSLADFIFAFTYETRDIVKAMPLNTNNILRIGVDLKYLFGITRELNSDEQKKIRQIYEEYDEARFAIGVDVDQYINLLNELLKKYQTIESVGDCVIDYLKLCCIDDGENQFKALYSKFKNSNAFSDNHIYDILEWWRKLAED